MLTLALILLAELILLFRLLLPCILDYADGCFEQAYGEKGKTAAGPAGGRGQTGRQPSDTLAQHKGLARTQDSRSL